MINRTDAWKCSDGSCYDNKQAAYGAEILSLYSKMPIVGNRSNTPLHFGKLIKEVDAWLREAVLTQKQMKEETDTETARGLAGQGG